MNQIDFSSRVGISQATLSELEHDKYKPSVEIIISIGSEFHTDLTWLLLGITSSDDKVDDVNDFSEKATDFLILFKKMKAIDQNEVIDFIKMKVNCY